jgi:hypothetical protein
MMDCCRRGTMPVGERQAEAPGVFLAVDLDQCGARVGESARVQPPSEPTPSQPHFGAQRTPESSELNSHVPDLQRYHRCPRAYSKLAGQAMIICVRGGT